VQLVALTFAVLWIFSLWLLVIERRRLLGALFLQPLALMGGTLLFFVLTLTGLVFLRLLIAD
jgi:hypothetical protein